MTQKVPFQIGDRVIVNIVPWQDFKIVAFTIGGYLILHDDLSDQWRVASPDSVKKVGTENNNEEEDNP
jgi:hypothetical protein